MITDTGNQMELKKALIIFVISGIIVITAGVLIGNLFFWGKYEVVNPVDKDIAYLEAMVKQNPNNDQVLVELGWYYYRQGNYEKAIKTLTKAISVNKLNPAAHFNLGQVYQEVKLLGKAEAEYQKTAEIDQESKVAYYALGKLYFTEEKWDEAISQLLIAVKKDPVSADNYYLLGQAYEKKGDKAEAKAAYRKVLDRVPNHAEAKEAYYRLK